MSCCFISFVTCPEIVGIETALHFSDCSSRSCGHRNAACLPRLLPLRAVSLSISHSSLLSFPHLGAYNPSFSRSLCPEAMTPALLGNLWLTLRSFFFSYFFFSFTKKAVSFPSFSSSLLFLTFSTLLRFSKHQSDLWREVQETDPLLYQKGWWWHTLSTFRRPHTCRIEMFVPTIWLWT